MPTFSKAEPAARADFIRLINERWGQLYQLETDWGQRTIRYLLLTNSGGAIATLGFIGASELALNLKGTKIALFLFILGVVLTGGTIAKQFHHMSGLFKAYKSDAKSFFADQITWEHLNAADDRRAVTDLWDYILPYGAFACFVGGCVAGAASLFG